MILIYILGKFDTASRRNAGVVVSGNSVYVTESAFKIYANYKNFWIFSNDNGSGNINTTTSTNNTVNYTRYVATQSSNLNVRSSASTSASKIGSLAKGTAVTVVKVSGDWSKISSPVSGWVSTTYLSSTIVENAKATSINVYKTGKYITTANLHVRVGSGTNYSAKTYKQLTTNARAQNKKLGNYYYSGYKKGVICTVTKVHGKWGLTRSGWICLDYCDKI